MNNPSRSRAVDWVDSLRPADSGREASRMGEPQRNRTGGWAHFEFTRMNITPTILSKEIEDLREAGASAPRSET
jgi:hypothetical protein